MYNKNYRAMPNCPAGAMLPTVSWRIGPSTIGGSGGPPFDGAISPLDPPPPHRRPEAQMLSNPPTHRAPTHPGEMLLEEYLKPLNLSMMAAARRLGVSQQLVNRIVRGEGPVTVKTALRLERLFGTSAGFWLNLQRDWDLWHEVRESKADLKRIQPMGHAAK